MAKLHIGCGQNILEGYINLDSDSSVPADVHRDILRGLPFNSDSINEIFSENFLEHLPQTEVIWVMNEMWRVLIPEGTMEHTVPMAGTMNRWQDPTHLSDWIPETLQYFNIDNPKNHYYSHIKPWKVVDQEVLNSGLAFRFILQKCSK